MNPNIGDIERITQNRVVKLFADELGYEYLGNWENREGNSNIEPEYLTNYLKAKKYSKEQISRVLDELKRTANNELESLYTNNKNFYTLLRYGAKIKTSANDNFETVHLIDWKHPEKNHFGIAEEVTIKGRNTKRPDIVLYVNGIALAVLELKRSTVSIGEGIRQNIANQKKEFIESFFSTVQLIFAGNDSAGLKYGTIGTEEKYYLTWKEDIEDQSRTLLDKYLIKMCSKARFLEIIYDYVLFDSGKKKLPRVHQYFGIKAAQEFVLRREGGIIWHTQGSGKIIVMIMLAKWILENNPNARVAIITDRQELDSQIERFFNDAEVEITRTSSGRDLMTQLEQSLPRLLCSLVHKFRKHEGDTFKEFIEELQKHPKQVVGELFVFVDEYHRTQSGKFHKIMKTILKNSVFIGFTGTPLLKADRRTSLEVFGRYIHTYKFNEAVEDGVVLEHCLRSPRYQSRHLIT